MADISNTESRERVITSADGLNDLIVNADGSINVSGSTINIITDDVSDVRAGRLYLANTGFFSIVTPTEIDYFLVKNPTGSGKVLTIHEIVITVDENIGATYRLRIYLNPTITSNGTSLTPVNGRQVGTVAVSSTTFRSPTISARGTLVYANNFVIGNPIVEPSTLLLDPNNNYLITLQVDNTANFNLCFVFAEQEGI